MTNKIGGTGPGPAGVTAPASTSAPAAPAKADAPAAPAKDSGWNAVGGFFKKVADGFVDGAAATIGVAELAGVRYPVSQYEAKVDNNLTRGSRIDDPKGYDTLKAQGFKGIVDLTMEGTNDEKYAAPAGLNPLNIKILDNTAPSTEQMKQFLDFATDPKNEPCYVHCEAGKGRTGVAVACYRMAVQGWTADEAIADGKSHGLALPGQIDFIKDFGDKLKAGQIPGYPKPAIP